MKRLKIAYLLLAVLITNPAFAAVEKYKLDIEGAHAFIQFKVKHLGYSWLYGRFNSFDGEFTIDRDNLESSQIRVTIDTTSIDSNHTRRDKHLRAEEFLNVEKFPEAKFVSKSLKLNQDRKSGILTGDLTLKGVTRSIDIVVSLIGEGKDPWGGYRIGFEGETVFALKDFGIKDFAPAATDVTLILSIEGIKL